MFHVPAIIFLIRLFNDYWKRYSTEGMTIAKMMNNPIIAIIFWPRLMLRLVDFFFFCAITSPIIFLRVNPQIGLRNFYFLFSKAVWITRSNSSIITGLNT